MKCRGLLMPLAWWSSSALYVCPWRGVRLPYAWWGLGMDGDDPTTLRLNSACFWDIRIIWAETLWVPGAIRPVTRLELAGSASWGSGVTFPCRLLVFPGIRTGLSFSQFSPFMQSAEHVLSPLYLDRELWSNWDSLELLLSGNLSGNNEADFIRPKWILSSYRFPCFLSIALVKRSLIMRVSSTLDSTAIFESVRHWNLCSGTS